MRGPKAGESLLSRGYLSIFCQESLPFQRFCEIPQRCHKSIRLLMRSPSSQVCVHCSYRCIALAFPPTFCQVEDIRFELLKQAQLTPEWIISSSALRNSNAGRPTFPWRTHTQTRVVVLYMRYSFLCTFQASVPPPLARIMNDFTLCSASHSLCGLGGRSRFPMSI